MRLLMNLIKRFRLLTTLKQKQNAISVFGSLRFHSSTLPLVRHKHNFSRINIVTNN